MKKVIKKNRKPSIRKPTTSAAPASSAPVQAATPQNQQTGFSLLELAVVLVIISLIAAFAVPRLLALRTTAIETSAQNTLRSTGTALMQASNRFNAWPADLASLGGTNCDTAAPVITATCGLDNSIAQSLAAGFGQYAFTYATSGGGFTIKADPLATSNAKRHLWMDSGLVMHYNDTAAASSTDPVIGQ